MTEAQTTTDLAPQPDPQQLTLRNREKIETIKKTVAKGASDAELEMLLTLGERYQLDVFLKELMWSPQIGIIAGRDAYLKIAQRNPDYEGMTSCAVCKGDHFEMDPVVPTVHHKFGAERGPVIGAYAVVFRKDRKPAVCFAPYAEYRKNSVTWNTYPSAMIQKVAESMALKRQFTITGLVSEDEVGYSAQSDTPPDNKPTGGQEVLTAAEGKLRDRIKTKADANEVFLELHRECRQLLGEESTDKLIRALLQQYGVKRSTELNLEQARRFALDLHRGIELTRADLLRQAEEKHPSAAPAASDEPQEDDKDTWVANFDEIKKENGNA